jgi:hypothetical protein
VNKPSPIYINDIPRVEQNHFINNKNAGGYQKYTTICKTDFHMLVNNCRKVYMLNNIIIWNAIANRAYG